MNYVIKGMEKVAVSSREDAKALMRALSDHNCKESISRQDVIGKSAEFNYSVSFDNDEISIGTSTMEDGEKIAHWMLELGVAEVIIRHKKEGDE